MLARETALLLQLETSFAHGENSRFRSRGRPQARPHRRLHRDWALVAIKKPRFCSQGKPACPFAQEAARQFRRLGRALLSHAAFLSCTDFVGDGSPYRGASAQCKLTCEARAFSSRSQRVCRRIITEPDTPGEVRKPAAGATRKLHVFHIANNFGDGHFNKPQEHSVTWQFSPVRSAARFKI